MTKPVNTHTLDSSIKILLQYTEKSNLFLRDGIRGPMIPIRDIIFLKVEGAYTYIQTNIRRYAFKRSLLYEAIHSYGKFCTNTW